MLIEDHSTSFFFQKCIIFLMWHKISGQLHHPDIFVYPVQKTNNQKKHTLYIEPVFKYLY